MAFFLSFSSRMLSELLKLCFCGLTSLPVAALVALPAAAERPTPADRARTSAPVRSARN